MNSEIYQAVATALAETKRHTTLKHKQESVSDWKELAKAYGKAEKEQGIEPYVIVRLCNKRTGEELYRYDIPRYMFWKYAWVFDWREARILCLNPRDGINRFIDFYDKTTGLRYGFGSIINRLTSAKAHITIAKNRLRQYVESQKDNMFFDEATDEIVAKFKTKIKEQTCKVAEIEKQIEEETLKIKTSQI